MMAEDDAEDRMLAQRAWDEGGLGNDLRFVENGEELMEYLQRRGKYADPKDFPPPGIIFLDLNMPRKDGHEALKEIKTDAAMRRIPVVVLTSSKSEKDIARSYDVGASSYIVKPATFDKLVDVFKILGKYWLGIVRLPPAGGQARTGLGR